MSNSIPPTVSTQKKAKRFSTQSAATGTTTSTSSSTASKLSTFINPLRAKFTSSPQSSQSSVQVNDHAEMMDEDNMSWGVPSSSRRQRKKSHS